MATQADYAEMFEKSSEMNLRYKTKIIELENELNHQKTRAKDYQNKFRDAVLQSQYSEGQQLLEKLNSKENELMDCRKQVIQLNRRLANVNNLPSQNDLMALAHENQELMGNIQEIKSAAISAIMMKQQEIEELNKTISRYELMENELKFQYEKYESLERQLDVLMKEKEEEVAELNEKNQRERQNFFNKLQIIQRQANQQQSFKQTLLEKTQDLQGTLQKSQMVISEYQHKISQLQSQINHFKIAIEQENTKYLLEIQDLKQNVKGFEKEQKFLHKMIDDLKSKDKVAQQNIIKLNELNDQLKHKLSIKKKKQNKTIKDKITSSFSGLSKNNPVYASFAFRAKDSIYEEQKHLGEIPEIEDLGEMIENISFDIGNQIEELKKEVPMSKVMSKNKDKTVQLAQTMNENQNLSSPEILKEIENYKQTILRLQTQKKQLQINLNDTYNQIQKINESLINLTNELQQERKNISQLRQQLKKTKKQSELIVEVQSLTLHVYKLENDMIASKMKYAEETDFVRQKYNREKLVWTQKLVQLTQRLAKQDIQISSQKQIKTEEKKKKKGFFG